MADMYVCMHVCTKSFLKPQQIPYVFEHTWRIKLILILILHFRMGGSGNISVVLLSMEGQIALRFNQKYLNLCSEDERSSYGFRTT